jgi:cell division protease FtsH
MAETQGYTHEMATAEQPSVGFPSTETSLELARQWRQLVRGATFVAVLTSPAVFLWYYDVLRWSLFWSLFMTIVSVAAFRGLVDIVVRRLIPWPSLFGTEERRVRDEEVVNRRRAWFWSRRYGLALWILALFTLIWVTRLALGQHLNWVDNLTSVWHWGGHTLSNPNISYSLISLPVLFLTNFVILFGPLLAMGISQIRAYEPGDARWGVRLDDVRGQAEAKEEVRRVVSLWQSGEEFERAGGKRERGLLFLGAPGTGKTMLAKAIATGFNSPFVSIPGSGFAGMFIGIDAVIVRWMARKAKRLARKWGGQCIVFIDEIDAVGMRRQALGGAPPAGGELRPVGTRSIHDDLFFGPLGALTPSGDLVLESVTWRDRLFAAREPQPVPSALGRVGAIVNQAVPGGMMGGGQLALNQLLVVMDGIDDPPVLRRLAVRSLNTLMDALYFVPQRLGRIPLRLPPAQPSGAQIYFIGATNVPIEQLDPALRRPGRMGRHVRFRTPTKRDRLDVFDLYLQKVVHEPALDTDRARDELSRITNGYSPAMIEQVCSMALTIAHHDRRLSFSREDLVEAMTTVESGTAIGIDYIPEETRAVAIHEAGHAAAAHVYKQGAESTRLSIRMRGGSLGHHMALERDERFSSWRSDEVANLIWSLGSMAAEHVFYGETSVGVGGDVFAVTMMAGRMVGTAGMGPERIELNGNESSRDELMKRFERIGVQIMNRSGAGGPGDAEHNPVGSVLRDPDKKALAAQLIGQAYVAAYNLVRANRDQIEAIADVLVERKELYGDELVGLLERSNLRRPEIDYLDEASWPAQ